MMAILCFLKRREIYVEIVVVTAVPVKNTVVWDVMPCNPTFHRRFGGLYSSHPGSNEMSANFTGLQGIIPEDINLFRGIRASYSL
jgi:hypothetical protein